MLIEIERYIKFIVENSLSQRQFLFLYLVYMERWDLMKIYIDKFPNHDGAKKFLSNTELQDLIDRNFIEKVGEGRDLTNFRLGKPFKLIFLDKTSLVAVDELLDVYPHFIKMDGRNIPLTLMDKYELRNLYLNRIGYELEEHYEVLIDIKYGVDNELIKGKIETFIRSEQWKAIRKIRMGEGGIITENSKNELE